MIKYRVGDMVRRNWETRHVYGIVISIIPIEGRYGTNPLYELCISGIEGTTVWTYESEITGKVRE